MDAGNSPDNLDRLMPHRWPMRWIDAYERLGAGRLRATGHVGVDHPFLGGDDLVNPVALIEWMAQACAVMCACEALQGGRPLRMGFLAGVRAFAWRALPRLGDELQVTVATEMNAGEAVIVQGTIERVGVVVQAFRLPSEPLASATLTVWEPTGHPLPDLAASSGPGSVPAARPDYRSLLNESLVGPVETTAEGATARFRFSEHSPVFDGHFPGMPILPGIGILSLATLLCEHWGATPLRLVAAAPTKFLRPVLPGELVTMELAIARSSGDGQPAAFRVHGRLAGDEPRKAVFDLEYRALVADPAATEVAAP